MQTSIMKKSYKNALIMKKSYKNVLKKVRSWFIDVAVPSGLNVHESLYCENTVL